MLVSHQCNKFAGVGMTVLVSGAALVVALLAVLVAAVVRLSRGGAPEPSLQADPAVRRARRRAAAWRGAGAVVGLAGAVLAVQAGSLGRGPMLAPAVFGLAVVAGVLAGELSVRPPSGGGRRSATLAVRRVRDYVPVPLGAAVAAAALGLLLLLAATTAAASPDDLGRAGRSLAGACSAVTGWASGPWPGSFYSVPLGVLVVAGLLASALVLRRVTARPRVGGSAALVDADEALRRRAAQTVTAACGILVAAPFAGVAAVTALVMGGHDCPPSWWGAARVALLLLQPALLALLGWCAAVLLVPTGARRQQPARA